MSLLNSLSLVVLYAQEGSAKFEPAQPSGGLRIYALEGRDVRMVDLQLAAAALLNLRGLRGERAEKTLLGLL